MLSYSRVRGFHHHAESPTSCAVACNKKHMTSADTRIVSRTYIKNAQAGNILIDRDGHVYLGDFGVAASLERGGSWGHEKAARMTFVGTPCWMAPEVMEQTKGCVCLCVCVEGRGRRVFLPCSLSYCRQRGDCARVQCKVENTLIVTQIV
jgi:serine/threonine protein kinase